MKLIVSTKNNNIYLSNVNKIFGCSDKANLSIVLFKSNQINFDKAIS